MAEFPAQSAASSHEDEINLREYWQVLVRQRWLIGKIVAACMVLATVVVCLLPKVYRSETTLIPLGDQQAGLEALMGELGGLLPLGLGGQENPAERILAVLSSRTVAEDVIQGLDLLPRLFPQRWDADKRAWNPGKQPTMQDGRLKLEELVTVTQNRKTNVITITAEHTDPELAAQMANQYVVVLNRALNENAFSLAKKNRLFLEEQLRKTKKALAVAEEAKRRFEEKYGIVVLQAQAEATIQTVAILKAEIMAKEVQLQVLQRSVTGASREITLLQEELQGLRSQFAQLQHGPTAQPTVTSSTSKTFLALDETPEVKLHYIRLEREVRIQNELFAFLTKQLEQTKIEEAKDETVFQVLDLGIVSDQDKYVKPKRALLLIMAMIVSVCIGVFTAIFRGNFDLTLRTREQVEKQVDLPVLVSASAVGISSYRRGEQRAALPHMTDHEAPRGSGVSGVEALRYLHMRLRSLRTTQGVKAILFTQACDEEGMETFIVNLAFVAAHAGEKVLLLDSNIRQPRLHSLLACPLSPGLTDLLANSQDIYKSIHTVAEGGLHFIPAGALTPTESGVLEPPALDTILKYGRETYDLILCVAPSVLAFSDAAILSSTVDATCFILTGGVSRLPAVIEAKAILESVQARIIGSVLVL